METFRKGDIVIFPFPYTDMTHRKIRPCLVISDEMKRDMILCQITSKNIKADSFTVEVNKEEILDRILQIDSYIRCNMIFTASKNQIIKKICSISDKKYSKVVSKIVDIIKKP